MEELIKAKLFQVESDCDVRILWAVESGSRSWGFESPDSDYDVRFLYVNRAEWYLSIEEGRDVIELPINDDLDISGWDLRKTLRLFRKSNPVLLEWLVSPLVYAQSGSLRDRLLGIAPDVFSRKACAYHYLSMAENNYKRYVAPRDPVKLKKYFYVLRPLLNIVWLRERDSIPPMSFIETVNTLELPEDVHKSITGLLTRKQVTSELGDGPKETILEEFMEAQLEEAAVYCEAAAVGNVSSDLLDEVFREIIQESWSD